MELDDKGNIYNYLHTKLFYIFMNINDVFSFYYNLNNLTCVFENQCSKLMYIFQF